MDQSEFGRIKNLLTASCATATISSWGTAPAAPTTEVTTAPTAGTSPAVATATTTLAPVLTTPVTTTAPAAVSGVREVKPVRCKKAEFGQTGQYQGVAYVCSDQRKDGTAYAAGYYMWRPA